VLAALFALSIGAQIMAKLSLNRSFGMVPANRGVVTSGLYGLVRHPVYASYLLGHIAFLLANPTLWNASLYAVALGLQLARMQAEERLLRRDPVYAAYAQSVRYRLVPGLY
jgi:protein-S-isoprenylcysteine O-methyltransferase Ste14